MRWSARLRRFTARHPRLRWVGIALAALWVGGATAQYLGDVDRQRNAWGRTATVVIARRDLPPGTVLTEADVMIGERPTAMVPTDALDDLVELPAGSRTWQWVSAGEVLVQRDLRSSGSPASRLPAGTRGVVIASRGLPAQAGDVVAIAVDGVWATDAPVIDVVTARGDWGGAGAPDSLLIAVPQRHAAKVASAVVADRATVMLAAPPDDQRQPAASTMAITPASTTR